MAGMDHLKCKKVIWYKIFFEENLKIKKNFILIFVNFFCIVQDLRIQINLNVQYIDRVRLNHQTLKTL